MKKKPTIRKTTGLIQTSSSIGRTSIETGRVVVAAAIPPFRFLRRVVSAAYRDNLFFLASALTFQALLAALPFVLLALAVLGYFVPTSDEEVTRLLTEIIPSAGSGETDPFRQVERFLTNVRESRGQLSVWGLPLFLWFSTRFFGGARTALNVVLHTHENRPWWKGVGIDIGLMFAALLLVVASMGLTILMVDLPWLGRFASGISTFSLGGLLFFLIFKISPTRKGPWDTAIVGAAVAALGFEVTKRLYVIYLLNFTTVDRLMSNTNAIALLLLVAWMYYTACVVLLGAEVAGTYDGYRRGNKDSSPQ